MNLNFGMAFPQLYTRDGLLTLDQRFLEELGFVSPELLKQLQQGRQQPDELTPSQEAALLIALGPYVENFIAKLFKIEARVAGLKMAHRERASSFATQAGCPLSEKIPEYHSLKASGHAIAALAMITVDTPMVAASGHRICNHQKQDAVIIPEIETRSFKDVLELPYGPEIHSLLTRWNPLNLRRPPGSLDSLREQCAVA